MISNHQKQLHLFQSHANAWGGFLKELFHQGSDTAAPSSLRAAGVFATERGEAFNFHRIVSHPSAYSLVGDRQAARVIDPYEAENYKDAYPWVLHRHGRMNAAPRTSGGGEPGRTAAPPKASGPGKQPPGKKPRTSGVGGTLDRLKRVPPKASGRGKQPLGKKPRTSGVGGTLDR